MAIPLLKEIIRRHLPVHFHCPNGLHLREITSEVSMLLFKAGFETIQFGFETSDPLRQGMMGGKVDNEELEEAVNHLRRAGYRNDDIGVYILCGLPGQPAGEVAESIRFVQSCGVRAIIAEYSPIRELRCGMMQWLLHPTLSLRNLCSRTIRSFPAGAKYLPLRCTRHLNLFRENSSKRRRLTIYPDMGMLA